MSSADTTTAEQAATARPPRRLILLVAVALLLLAAALWMVRTRGDALDRRITIAVRVVSHDGTRADAQLPVKLGDALTTALERLDTTRVHVVPWRWGTRWDRRTSLLYDGDRAFVLDYLVHAELSHVSDSVRVVVRVERPGDVSPVWHRNTAMLHDERETGFGELAEDLRSGFAENLRVGHPNCPSTAGPPTSP